MTEADTAKGARMADGATIADYGYAGEEAFHSDTYLMPTVQRFLEDLAPGKNIFELGCGNGAAAAELAGLGYRITGIDPSDSGIAIAQTVAPMCRLELGSSDEDLAARFGMFDVVLSLEVAEHVYAPMRYAKAIDELLQPGGIAIISTPYHAYLKNLVLAASGKLDGHFTALWEGGHIKFWSRGTLGTLFDRAGLEEIAFARVGRIPVLAKSMIAVYRKRGVVRDV